MPTIRPSAEALVEPSVAPGWTGRVSFETPAVTPPRRKPGPDERPDGLSVRSLKPRSVLSNAMTIDVEDYFQVEALASCFPRQTWTRAACRVERNIDSLLALLDGAKVHATFFTLGWIAERFPALVRHIASGGHELASHGYSHCRADAQQHDEFRQEVRHSKQLIEDIAGCAVIGYRAPSFSIGLSNLWAFELLEEEGYAYSSSVYPIRHDLYGIPNAPRFPFHPGKGQLLEIPLTTARRFGANIPSAGGGYFRLLPYRISRANLRRVNTSDRRSCVFYLHPWEIDPEQPRVSGIPWRSRIRHYINLDATERRLKRLLADFRWGRMTDVFLSETDQPVAPHVQLH